MAGVNRKATRTGNSLFPYIDSRVILDTAKIFRGEMIQQDANSEVAPATDVASVLVLGVSIKEVDNTADGETLEDIEASVLLMDNSETNAVAKTDIGTMCFVEDAATVSTSTTNSNSAGVVTEVTSEGVYVDFDPAKKV